MGMGRGGLVAYVEAELERQIALGQIHPSGQFASEVELARRMKVCRGTMREALRRLAARGLVVQRPGRKTRAVALDESLTLENLGLALHDARSSEARWLLDGYFSLRRQVLIELLVDCCAKASERDLDALGSLCFRLWDIAKWELGERCAQVEFELLRLAARVAERPGHVLLVQSLHRAFLGGAARLLPFMGGEALREWVICASDALRERDTQALQQNLPTLMRAYDERLLNAFAPSVPKPFTAEAPPVQEPPQRNPPTVIEPCGLQESGPGAATEVAGQLGPIPKPDVPTEACPCVNERGLGHPVQITGPDEALESRPDTGEDGGHGCLVPIKDAALMVQPIEGSEPSAMEDPKAPSSPGGLLEHSREGAQMDDGTRPGHLESPRHLGDGLTAAGASMAYCSEPPASS
ncbi:FadR/GntR family transcriptional regulator [Corallococcus sp. EGB]|uniref:FadR/GntR family transcriptional regulator n=1 Tax=Corallococcus sp. EGB TaxID=1521117 RepID=UPI001CBD0118|nr:GntR family transcriptional regulator [Corallococcus sp. EGB]